MHDHFREFIQLLNAEAVEYVVVGGFAVAKHGYPRYTGDLDVFIAGTKENAEKMLNVMLKFGFDVYDFALDDFFGDERFVSVGDEPYKIEILTQTLGITFEEAYQNREIVDNHNLKINFISYQDLIKNKKAVGRPKDLLDIENLPPP
jgi:hypothetical protein